MGDTVSPEQSVSLTPAALPGNQHLLHCTGGRTAGLEGLPEDIFHKRLSGNLCRLYHRCLSSFSIISAGQSYIDKLLQAPAPAHEEQY